MQRARQNGIMPFFSGSGTNGTGFISVGCASTIPASPRFSESTPTSSILSGAVSVAAGVSCVKMKYDRYIVRCILAMTESNFFLSYLIKSAMYTCR